MRKLSQDLSVFRRLELEVPPVGVKFSFLKPEGIAPLGDESNIALCEMVSRAQKAEDAFYFSRHHKERCVGKIFLGMQDMEPFAESGMIGERLGIFQEARANQNLYQHIYTMGRGTVNYVTFAKLDKITFDPDVLVVTAPPAKAEIIMRAYTYATGQLYTSTATPVMGCTWFLIYPYKTGKLNYIIPEFVEGPRSKTLWGDNNILVSIPYQVLPDIVRNMNEMDWDVSYESAEAHDARFEKILEQLLKESADEL